MFYRLSNQHINMFNFCRDKQTDWQTNKQNPQYHLSLKPFTMDLEELSLCTVCTSPSTANQLQLIAFHRNWSCQGQQVHFILKIQGLFFSSCNRNLDLEYLLISGLKKSMLRSISLSYENRELTRYFNKEDLL